MLAMEQDKNYLLDNENKELKEEKRGMKGRIGELEREVDKGKEEIYWVREEKDKEVRGYVDQIVKLKTEKEELAGIIRDLERELAMLRKKPIQDA